MFLLLLSITNYSYTFLLRWDFFLLIFFDKLFTITISFSFFTVLGIFFNLLFVVIMWNFFHHLKQKIECDPENYLLNCRHLHDHIEYIFQRKIQNFYFLRPSLWIWDNSPLSSLAKNWNFWRFLWKKKFEHFWLLPSSEYYVLGWQRWVLVIIFFKNFIELN